MKAIVGSALILSACLATTIANADAVPVPPKVTEVCQGCHGPAGNSVTPTTPRLNGQQADYIVAQLKNFLYPGSEDPHATAAMWGVVQNVDNATFVTIANYYASQTPVAPQGAGPLAVAGKKFYANGDPSDRISACVSCHGAHGEGKGVIPRLAGQHAQYLRNQLNRLRLQLRSSDTMHPQTNNMSDRQIEEIVAYLANN